jgi:predicted outer membrane repeat protein
MTRGHRWLVGVGAVIGLAAVLPLIAAPRQASLADGIILYVDADATGANNGSSWTDAFTTLQLALMGGAPVDQIWVAAGTYKPADGADRTISFALKNGLAIYGGFDPSVGDDTWEERDWVNNVVVLSGDIGTVGVSADNSYHVFYHPAGTNLDGTAILDGVTITGGYADGAAGHYYGGGMYNLGSSPSLVNVTFAGNLAGGYGGGMHNSSAASPSLTGCTFSGNSAVYGGGMYSYASSPVLTGCTFESNTANYGAGMYSNEASPVLTGCVFTGNSAGYDGGGMYNDKAALTLTGCTFSGNSAGGDGGGIYNSGSSPVLSGCTFVGNSAGPGYSNGGGMHNDGSSPALSGCTFAGNSAGMGGGMHNANASAPTLVACAFSGNSAVYGGGGMFNSGSSPLLANCTFEGNTASLGGGMRNGTGSTPRLTNCTFSANSASRGGGIYNWDASPALTNCILWADAPDEIYNYDLASAPVVAYSDIQGGYPAGTGNIDADPRFVDAAGGDLHLGACSPCIDAGDNAAPNLPAYDFEGDDRILDGDGSGTAIVDMGVDEVIAGACSRLYLPLVLRGY